MRKFRTALLLFLMVFSLNINICRCTTFISLKSSEINMRVGPGKEYPLIWIFMKPHLPMLLIAEFDQWRKVKFLDNTEGWVHKNMVSKRNTVIVSKDYVIMYRHTSRSTPVAKITRNVIMRVVKSEKDWLKVETNGMKGWIERKYVWGINDNN